MQDSIGVENNFKLNSAIRRSIVAGDCSFGIEKNVCVLITFLLQMQGVITAVIFIARGILVVPT